MLLKNMLEKKKLNLSQPILSVWKYSPMKFNGRKIENGLPIIPTRLPPSVPVKIAGAVPFQWEKTPGKPKENSDTPPNEANHHDSHNIQTEESKSFQSEDCDDEALVDALDTLSRIESFLLNSRAGGPCLTGKDYPQTLELMMDRFLPAPKSMYAAKKQSPVGQQQQRLKMKIVNCNNPGLQYGHSIAKRYKEKEEISDNDSDQHRYLLPNCGLRPRFCLNTSVCLVKNEYKVKSNDKGQAGETKEKKCSWKKNEKAVVGVPEETGGSNRKTFQELLADPKELDYSGGSVVHNKLKNTRPFYPNTSQRMEQMHVVDSSLEAFKNRNTRSQTAPNFNIVSSSIPKTHGKWGMEMPKDFAENQDSTEKKLSITLGKKYSEFLVPPLLKSPSDSWLFRTLPSMSTSRHSYLQRQGPL